MKTLIGYTKHFVKPSEKNEFVVYELEHDAGLDLSQSIPDILDKESPTTTVAMPDGDQRGISEQILSYFLEERLSCRLRRFDFTTRAGAIGADLSITDNSLAIALTYAAEIPLTGKGSPPDFFDKLRELDDTLKELSESLRGINDPVLKDSRVAQVLAAVKCLRIYTDLDDDSGPDTIPGSIVDNAKKELNWSGLGKLGDRVANLANAAAKLLDAISKWFL